MRTRATDNGVVDAYGGARTRAAHHANLRHELQASRRRAMAEVDLGEPRAPAMTLAFLLLTGLLTLLEFSRFGASPDVSELARAGGAGVGTLATGAWWKLLVANLLHSGVPHLLSNVFVIYLTGRWLEHLVGRTVVLATILWAALLASLGSLLVDTPAVSIGASGVAFGLVGCAIAVDPRARTGVGVIGRQLAIVNVVLTFAIPGISIGGHLGGLVGGLLVGGIAWHRASADDRPAGRPRRVGALVLVVAALPIVVALAAAPRELPDALDEPRRDAVAWLVGRQLSGSRLSSGTDVTDATCRPTDDALRYRCDVDGEDGSLRFSTRDDQWRLSS